MSYNLENPEELYEFSQACEEACCLCPQYRPWNPIDFNKSRNEVSPFEVFMWWKEPEPTKSTYKARNRPRWLFHGKRDQ